jgi:hypothetical protein
MCNRNHFLIPDRIASIAINNDKDQAIYKVINNKYFIKNLFRYQLEYMFIMRIVDVEDLYGNSFGGCEDCQLEYNDYGIIYNVVGHCVYRVLHITKLIILLSEKMPLVVCGRLFGLLGAE